MPIFFGLFLIFIAWFTYKRHQAVSSEKQQMSSFLDREQQANLTRKKDISTLPYLQISLESLPFGISSAEGISELEDQLRELSQKPILNLTGISNTDLKLMYGAANLDTLSSCDDNFTKLCQILYQWGQLLYENGFEEAACQVLSYAVTSGSDISGNYLLLAEIYQASGKTHLISDLLLQAECLNSLSKDIIILKLSEFVHN